LGDLWAAFPWMVPAGLASPIFPEAFWSRPLFMIVESFVPSANFCSLQLFMLFILSKLDVFCIA